MQSILFFPHLALDASGANVQRTKRRVVIEENYFSANTFAKYFLNELGGYSYRISSGLKESVNLMHAVERQSHMVHLIPAVYLNPANEFIRFEMDKTAIGHNSVVVTNEIGKVVWSERFHGNLNDYQIDISTFSSGVYFYQVLDALGSASGKFVVIH